MPEPQIHGEGWTPERAAILLKAGLIAGIALVVALVWRPWKKKTGMPGLDGPENFSTWEPEQ